MPEIMQYHHFTTRSERKSAASLIAIFDLSLWLKRILKTSYKCSLKVQSNFLLIRLHLKSGTEARAVPSPLLPFTFCAHQRMSQDAAAECVRECSYAAPACLTPSACLQARLARSPSKLCTWVTHASVDFTSSRLTPRSSSSQTHTTRIKQQKQQQQANTTKRERDQTEYCWLRDKCHISP